jgi:hypothetical protein
MASISLLNVNEKVMFDNAITNVEYHSYQSYIPGELKYNDECRIVIQQQELLTAPGLSQLHIQGRILKHDQSAVSTKVLPISNFIAHLFDEIRLELGGVIVDRIKNPGITTTMKGYVSHTPNESTALINAGWSPIEDTYTNFDAQTGAFDVCWPLSNILGFAEDYKKVVLNLRQELILLRSSTDLNATLESTGLEKAYIRITKIVWQIPHFTVSDEEKLKLFNIIEKNNPLSIAHRRWELFTYPLLQESHSFTWVLKSSTSLEKPRFVIIGFQTDRKNNLRKDASKFDHCHLKNIKLYLNSQSYPYENLNLDYRHNQYALAYDMYARFQQSYYYNKKMICEPLFKPAKFKTDAPLLVIDCSYQNETFKNGTVDARIEFETLADMPANTSAFCLVLYEQFVSYEPLTGRVRIL